VMGRFKSFLMMGLAVCVAAGPALAQQGGRGRNRGDGLTLLRLPAPLAEKLQITADQKTKLEALGERQRTESAAIRQNAAGDRQAANRQLRELSTKIDAEAAALLNADQRKNWDAWSAEHKNVAGLGRSATALLMVSGLSDEQKGKLKTLATDTQAKRQQLFQGVQGGAANNPELRQKAEALETETQTGVKGVLNADQVKQYEAGLAALPQRRRPNQ
jgi:periplasmic protein CpxP/Spy